MSVLDLSLENLPVHVMVDILSRLPVKTIIHCKCVCKKWLDLVSDSYFANLHLSRSPASLMIHRDSENQMTGYYDPGKLGWAEIEDELDGDNLNDNPAMSLDLNLVPIFQNSRTLLAGAVDGLLCLWQYGPRSDNTYICNPITREYMILPVHRYRPRYSISAYCFGVGSLTREYKVMRIFPVDFPKYSTSSSQPTLTEAEVYTLGTGQWRSLGHVPYMNKGLYGPILNGHAHWTAADWDYPEKICAFDFDRETFGLFPSPPSESQNYSQNHFTCLGVIKGCLCRCDNYNSKFTFWVMKEYGIKKSWQKEFVIEKGINPVLDLLILKPISLIEGSEDGTILMATYSGILVVYSPRSKTIVDMENFKRYFKGLIYHPSFHRLCDFENERVHVFLKVSNEHPLSVCIKQFF